MQTKICTKCRKKKSLCEFNNKANKKGLRTQCKQCDNNYTKQYRAKHREETKTARRKWYRENHERAKQYAKNYRERNLDRVRANQRKNNKKYYDKYVYGLGTNARLEMYGLQNRECAICGKFLAFNKTCIDHDHKTGKVRGLLCHSCNRSLAGLEDAEFNRKATVYLKNSA